MVCLEMGVRRISERTADSNESVDSDNISRVLSLSSEISELAYGNGTVGFIWFWFQVSYGIYKQYNIQNINKQVNK